MITDERYILRAEKELEVFYDKYFINDSGIENYCKEKYISTNKE